MVTLVTGRLQTVVRGWGIEQDQEPDEPVLDGEAVVMHEPSADAPAFVLVQGPHVAQLLTGRDLKALADVLVLAAPLDEVAYVPLTGVPEGQIVLAWDAGRGFPLIDAFAVTVRETFTGSS